MSELSNMDSRVSPSFSELSDQNLIIQFSNDSINVKFGHIPVQQNLPNEEESYHAVLKICTESQPQLIILIANNSLEEPLAHWLRHRGIELVVLTIPQQTRLDSAMNLIEVIHSINTHATIIFSGGISVIAGVLWTSGSLANVLHKGQNVDFQSLWKGPVLIAMGIVLFWIIWKKHSRPETLADFR